VKHSGSGVYRLPELLSRSHETSNLLIKQAAKVKQAQDASSYQRFAFLYQFPLGYTCLMLRIYPGVLVQCDPSIKSIIVKIDNEEHAFIVEELDDQTLVIKENMMTTLKMKLDEVDALAA
jgi:TFIIH basal transcription factor complex TTD-A subunit